MQRAHVDEWLNEYLDGELAPEYARRVEAHIASCAACAERLNDLRSVQSALRELGEVEPHAGFHARLMKRLDAIGAAEAARAAVPSRSPAPRSLPWRWVQLGAAAAAIAVATSAGALMLGRGDRPGTQVAVGPQPEANAQPQVAAQQVAAQPQTGANTEPGTQSGVQAAGPASTDTKNGSSTQASTGTQVASGTRTPATQTADAAKPPANAGRAPVTGGTPQPVPHGLAATANPEPPATPESGEGTQVAQAPQPEAPAASAAEQQPARASLAVANPPRRDFQSLAAGVPASGTRGVEYFIDLEIQVDDPAAAEQRLQELATRLNGVVVRTGGGNGQPVEYLVRVPTNQANVATVAVASLGDVKEKQVGSVDRAATVAEIDRRIAYLQGQLGSGSTGDDREQIKAAIEVLRKRRAEILDTASSARMRISLVPNGS